MLQLYHAKENKFAHIVKKPLYFFDRQNSLGEIQEVVCQEKLLHSKSKA